MNAAMAVPPYERPRRSVGVAVGQYLRLLRVMLAEYRTNWWFFVLFGGLMPMGMIFLFRYMGVAMNPAQAVYLMGGNLTTSVVFGPAMMLVTKIGYGRQYHVFDYWASLPLPKLALILAIITVSVLFALPGLALVYVAGSLMLGLPLLRGLALLPLVPLGALSLSGLAALLGIYAKDGFTSNQYANALMAFVVFLSPMMIPMESMPVVLRAIAYVVPTTYVADGFRAALDGRFGLGFGIDVGVLVLYIGAFLLLVHRKLDWRAG